MTDRTRAHGHRTATRRARIRDALARAAGWIRAHVGRARPAHRTRPAAGAVPVRDVGQAARRRPTAATALPPVWQAPLLARPDADPVQLALLPDPRDVVTLAGTPWAPTPTSAGRTVTTPRGLDQTTGGIGTRQAATLTPIGATPPRPNAGYLSDRAGDARQGAIAISSQAQAHPLSCTHTRATRI